MQLFENTFLFDSGMQPCASLRAALLAMNIARVRELNSEDLMLLLRDAVSPGDVDELFAELYGRFRDPVTMWCRRFMKDRDRADDMSQEVFMRAFRYRKSFRGDARASTWLYAIARNYCLTTLKKAADEPSSGAALLDPRLRGSNGLETIRQMEHAEEFSAAWRLVHSTLTPLEARVMILHYGMDMPLAEITRRMALRNPSGAKGYIVNARRKIGTIVARRRHKTNVRTRNADSAQIAA